MRLAYSVATALAAVFASSGADSTGVTANALPEPHVSLVARVMDSNAYDTDPQRLLRQSFGDDDSTLSVDREERINTAHVSDIAGPMTGEIATSGFLARALDQWAFRSARYGQVLGNFKEQHKILGKPLKWWDEIMKRLSNRSFIDKFTKWAKSLKVEGKSIGDRFTQAFQKYTQTATKGAADVVDGQAVWTRLDEWGGKVADDASLYITNALKTMDESKQLAVIKISVNAVAGDLAKLKATWKKEYEPQKDVTSIELAYSKFDSTRIDIHNHLKTVIDDLSKVGEDKVAGVLKTNFKSLDDFFEGLKFPAFKKFAEGDGTAAAALPTVKLPEPLPGSPLGTPGTPKDSNPKVE
ncbi:unnamed protein product [Hyaloperonospora brassicae]|uniref:RxLR effector candidate protein n=1 Tax=Hyaloperonospora brassicae TaxID=162125 RepID=A0AAV0U704_HYABA|nr:unnamed protein product [Hyaloperonospora brassicae]